MLAFACRLLLCRHFRLEIRHWRIQSPPDALVISPDLSMRALDESSLLTDPVSPNGALVQQAKAQAWVLSDKSVKCPSEDETRPLYRASLSDVPHARIDDQSRCRWQLKRKRSHYYSTGVVEEPLRLCGKAPPQASCSANHAPPITYPTGKQDDSRLNRSDASRARRFCRSCSSLGRF